MTAPGVAVMHSSFGGGWIWALNDKGAQALFSFFGEPPTEIQPIMRAAYIVEPQDADGLADHLDEAGVAWRLE